MIKAAGDTFRLSVADPHLWVVITTPVGKNGVFIAVNMTSIKNGVPKDGNCVILPGEHPFVVTETEMYYIKAREWQVSGFDSLASYGASFQPNKPVTNALLLRIQQGALASTFMETGFQKAVRRELGLSEPIA